MHFTIRIEADVERTEGKFASRDEIGELLEQAAEDANPGDVEGDAGGQYEVTEWIVEQDEQQRAPRKGGATPAPGTTPADWPELLRRIDHLFDAYGPPQMEDPVPGPDWDHWVAVGRAVESLMTLPGLGEAIRKAKRA